MTNIENMTPRSITFLNIYCTLREDTKNKYSEKNKINVINHNKGTLLSNLTCATKWQQQTSRFINFATIIQNDTKSFI